MDLSNMTAKEKAEMKAALALDEVYTKADNVFNALISLTPEMKEFYSFARNKRLAAILIAYHISGKTETFEHIIDYCGKYGVAVTNDDIAEYVFLMQKVHTKYEIAGYKELDISEYEISTCKDDRVCEKCRKFNGKKFPVSEAKIGVNTPPFHKGCRCTTLAVLQSEEELNKELESELGDEIGLDVDFDEWKNGLQKTKNGGVVYRSTASQPNLKQMQVNGAAVFLLVISIAFIVNAFSTGNAVSGVIGFILGIVSLLKFYKTHKCPSCKTIYWNSQKSCPNCGKPQGITLSGLIGAFVFVVVLGFIFIPALSKGVETGTSNQTRTTTSSRATTTARTTVRTTQPTVTTLSDAAINPDETSVENTDVPADSTTSEPDITWLNDDFALVSEVKGEVDAFSTHVYGIVYNASGRDFSYVQITYSIYDDSGNKIDTAIDNISNLKNKETWKFDAISLSAGARFKFEEITAF